MTRFRAFALIPLLSACSVMAATQADGTTALHQAVYGDDMEAARKLMRPVEADDI